MATELKDTQVIEEEVQAGEVGKEVTETATVTETDVKPTEGVSIEDIVSDKPLTEEEKLAKAKAGTPKWAQKRFDELTKEKAILEKKVQELENAKAIPTERPLPPSPNAFENDTDYQKAVVEWKDKDDAWKAQHQNISQQQEERQRVVKTNEAKFDRNAERLIAKYPDFSEKVQEVSVSTAMKEELEASDLGPEIFYFLANNPVEFQRMLNLSPREVAKEVGKLEVRFTEVKTKLKSDAPPALKTIEGNDTLPTDLSKIKDDNEWFQKWKAQKAVKFHRKNREALNG